MELTPKEKWNECCRILGDNLLYTEYNNWIKPVQFLRYDENYLHLSVPSKEDKDHIEENYLPLLKDVLQSVFGPNIKLFYHYKFINKTKR